MAYVYGKLKEAILGSQGDKMSKDLSPNMIKAIYIGRTNIVVAYHTKSVRVVHLDFEKVSQELGSGNMRNESLNNVLNKYKMGCVEEIYADSAYKNIPGGYLDLQRYVDGLNRCRLRYYGWFSGDAQMVAQYYESARVQHNYLYCVANDTNVRGKVINIEAYPVQGKAEPWYKVHDLRPNDYSADNMLGRYFSAVDAEIKAKVEAAEAEVEGKKSSVITKMLIAQEIEYINEYKIYQMLYILSSKGCFGDIGEIMKKHFFDIQVKNSVKRAIDIDCDDKSKMSAVENSAKLIIHGSEGDTCLLKNISVDELSKRLDSGNLLFGTRNAYYERMKSIVRYANNSNVLKLTLYTTLNHLNHNCKGNVESMLGVIEQIGADDLWFEVYNEILCGILGFADKDAVFAFTKAIGGK